MYDVHVPYEHVCDDVSGAAHLFVPLVPFAVVPSLGLLGLPLRDDDVLLLKLHRQRQQVVVDLHQTMAVKIGGE
jgi:hypothetical protein